MMASGLGNVIVRPAEQSDCEEIYQLIKELAEHHNLTDQLKINADVLRRDGFGEEKFFHCIVAVENQNVEGTDSTKKTIVGYALYYFVYSTFKGRALYMEDLYVTARCRGRGIGTTLWKHLAQVALAKECQRMQFIVMNWNRRSIEFYQARGAFDMTIKDKWHLFRLNRPDLEKLAHS